MISEIDLWPPYTHVHPHNNTQLPIHYSLVGFIALFESCIFRILSDSMQIALYFGGEEISQSEELHHSFPPFQSHKKLWVLVKEPGLQE